MRGDMMNNDLLTLTLDGDIPLDLFARAVTHFKDLVVALSDEASDDQVVEWHIEHLQSGSAIIEIRPYADDIEIIDRIVRAYDEVGEALANREPVPFSQAVANAAYGLTGLLNGKITGLALQTRYNRFTITEAAPIQHTTAAAHRPAWGEVRGEVGGITRRPNAQDTPNVQITIYDELFGRAVACHLGPGWHDKVTQYWGKRIAVTGLVYRDAQSDRPYKVREITSINILRLPSGEYWRARGAIPWQLGDEPAEASIRRLRDEPNEI